MYQVLVVEDEMWIRNAVIEMVERIGNDFTVVTEATNGEEAWELINELWPTIVISDIMMPKLDGLELVRRIDEHHLPIVSIILSGYDNFHYAQKVIRYGASDYLLKPVSEEDLKSALERALIGVRNLHPMHMQVTEIQAFIHELPRLEQHQLTLQLDKLLHSLLEVRGVSPGARIGLIRILSSKWITLVQDMNPAYEVNELSEFGSDAIRLHFREILEGWMKSYYPQRNNDVKWGIKKAAEFVRSNYANELSLTDIAKQSNLSVSYFSVLFKEHTGYSFIDYVNRVRMDKAKELLLEPDLKIYEVAEILGYSSVPYFNRLFKNGFGASPKEFRKSLGL